MPFCAFKTELSSSGKEHAEMQLPVCSNFSTVLIDGKLCHTISMNVTEPEPGAKNGLLLFIDPMIGTPLNLAFKEEGNRNMVLSKGLHHDKKFAELHLGTLSPHTSSKNGTHILNSLKRVTGSESFLAQSEERKGCSNEEFEVCQSRRYLLAVEQQCGCVPWLATFLLEDKVTIIISLACTTAQNVTTCSTDAFECHKSLAEKDFGCRDPCTGLYAGILTILTS